MLSGPFTLADRLRRRRRPDVRINRAYGAWLRREVTLTHAATGGLISVVMPVFDPPPVCLDAAIRAVRLQSFAAWELCIADDASTAPGVADVLLAHQVADARIRVLRLPRNTGIAAATNAAIGEARGGFVALLDHDDVLAPHALARVAAEIAAHPDAELIFSDEDKLVDGRRCRPYFKPGWNPDLMLSQNLVSHLGVYRRDRVLAVGGLRQAFAGSQDYDLALRVAAGGAGSVRHIPEVLYHWRQLPRSFSATHAATAQRAARAAVAAMAPPGTVVVPDPALPQWHRVIHPVPAAAPLVSIVVAGGGSAPSDPDYPHVEQARDGADRARGELLLFLGAGLVAGGAGWLRELVGQALRPGVGAVGGRLDQADGRIAQSGLVLDPIGIARTLRPRSDASDPGYLGQFRLPRTVSAVSGDCLAVRRDVFAAAGGLDPACGRYADIDLCLRLARSGLRCVWTPHACLRYTAKPPMRPDRRGARLMRARWGRVLAADPFFNPNLTVRHGNLALRRSPRPPGNIAP